MGSTVPCGQGLGFRLSTAPPGQYVPFPKLLRKLCRNGSLEEGEEAFQVSLPVYTERFHKSREERQKTGPSKRHILLTMKPREKFLPKASC